LASIGAPGSSAAHAPAISLVVTATSDITSMIPPHRAEPVSSAFPKRRYTYLNASLACSGLSGTRFHPLTCHRS
jgi:hypothetical protein